MAAASFNDGFLFGGPRLVGSMVALFLASLSKAFLLLSSILLCCSAVSFEVDMFVMHVLASHTQSKRSGTRVVVYAGSSRIFYRVVYMYCVINITVAQYLSFKSTAS